jgi:hypothetical protein
MSQLLRCHRPHWLQKRFRNGESKEWVDHRQKHADAFLSALPRARQRKVAAGKKGMSAPRRLIVFEIGQYSTA